MARVLIIDDNDYIRSFLETALQFMNHETLIAEDGDIGVSLYYSDPVDLVLTDLVMPNKNGIEVIEEIISGFPDAKIIAMSGSTASANGLLRQSLQLGARKVLKKPFTMQSLIHAVSTVLYRSGPRPGYSTVVKRLHQPKPTFVVND